MTSMADLNYRLEQLDFDGPLDLLLQLIEKHKIDICDIPIVQLTEQYFLYINAMEEQDLEIMSEFLVMASVLLDIKARMLLPRAPEEGPEEADPREELTQRLLEYKRYKYISGELRTYEESAKRFYYRPGELPEELKAYVPPVDLDEMLRGVSMELLRSVYARILKRMNAAENPEGQKFFGVIRTRRLSLAGCIEGLVSYARRHRRFSFRQMLKEGADRTEVVVSFLAVLELIRMGKVSVSQQETGEDIAVEVNRDADLDDLDLSTITEDL